MGKQHRIAKAQLKAQNEEQATLDQRVQAQPLAKILALFLALLTFAIYALTLFPTVPGGD